MITPLILFAFFLTNSKAVAFEINTIVLELGEQRKLPLGSCAVVTAYTSSDSLLNLAVTKTSVSVKALEFGAATVSVYCYSGVALFRVIVPSQSAIAPNTQPTPTLSGSQGAVGTRAAFRSSVGLVDDLVSREEFFRYSDRLTNYSVSGALTAVDPIFFPDPKPARVLEQMFWEYRRNDATLSFRIGDLNPLQKLVTGPVRGGRVDTRLHDHSLGLWGGVLRSGAGDPLSGSLASPVAGLSDSWQFTSNTKLSAYGMAFAKNPPLSIPESAMEFGVRGAFHRGVVSTLEFGLIADPNGRVAADAALGLTLEPISLNAQYSIIPDNMAVYSLPSRFSQGSRLFGLSLLAAPENRRWQTGVGFGRSLAFSQVDGSVGQSRLDNATLDGRIQLNDTLEWRVLGTFYTSAFTPFSDDSSHNERGSRLESNIDWSLTDHDSATAALGGHAIEASREGFNYENQQLALGWKHRFGLTTKNFIHFETGASHLRYPVDDRAGGMFFLSRVSSLWDIHFLKLDALVQGETRMAFVNGHTLRAQIGMQFTPVARHEIRLTASHNFEWARNVYSNTRGLYLFYAHHFGTDKDTEAIAAPWQRAKIGGRIYIDSDPFGAWGAGDKSMASIPVTLLGSSETQHTRSRADGTYHFDGLVAGIYRVAVDVTQLPQNSRLVSESEREVVVRPGATAELDFVMSEGSEIVGRIFDDYNGNEKLDDDEPILTGATVYWEGANYGEAEIDAGVFRLRNLSPGSTRIGLNPATLPSGYFAPAPLSVDVHPNTIIQLAIAVSGDRGISGELFIDTNGNRRKDPSEKGIDGARVRFGKATALTGNQGKFLFRALAPGKARVQFRHCRSEELEIGAEPRVLHGVAVPCSP